jgi:hypothetical protein
MPVIPVTILMLLAILAYDGLHCFLQRFLVVLGRQREGIPSVSKQIVPYLAVDFQTLGYCHAQPCQHNRYQTACACAVHEVEVVTGEKLILVEYVSVGAGDSAFVALQAAFAFGDFVHETLEDEQAGVASDATTICRPVSIGSPHALRGKSRLA